MRSSLEEWQRYSIESESCDENLLEELRGVCLELGVVGRLLGVFSKVSRFS